MSEKAIRRRRLEPAAQPFVLVTGAARGLGEAIAHRVAVDGCTVGVGYRSSVERAERVVADIRAEGGAAREIHLDVTDERSIASAFRLVRDTYGRLDGMVNNAGVNQGSFLARSSIPAIRKVVETNLLGTVLCTREAIRLMSRGQGGGIVNIGSVTAVTGTPTEAVYSATKSALIGFTKSIAIESARSGIHIHVIQPGLLETDMVSHVPPEVLAVLKRLAPPVTPTNVADTVAFFLQPAAQSLNGCVVSVDGGMSARTM